MHSYLMALHHAGVDIHYMLKNDAHEQIHVRCLQEGDCLEITDHGVYVKDSGWFLFTILNKYTRIFLSYHDLEEGIKNKQIVNIADMEIKLSLWQKQIDQALEAQDKEWFAFIARKLSKLSSLRSVG